MKPINPEIQIGKILKNSEGSGMAKGMEESFFLASEAEMETFAVRVSKQLIKGDIVFLHGNLGAGKTTFTRGLLKALGFHGRVKSPTFTLVEPYDLSMSHGFYIYHYDLYRINFNSPEELENLGIRDQINKEDVLVVEWPDRLKNLIQPSVEIFIDFCDQSEEKTKEKPDAGIFTRQVRMIFLRPV
jgi:tRNA threonylcarbamoyladenosine biosynthesis protein TsaE